MSKVYATTCLLHDGGDFEPGDELQHHYTPEQLERLIAHGHASPERPPGVEPVYALVDDLAYHPGPSYRFRRGDRIDGVIPRCAVRVIVERGDASTDRPSDVHPAYALRALSHRPHGVGVDFAAGERVDGRVPDGVLADWVRSGHVSYDEPA